MGDHEHEWETLLVSHTGQTEFVAANDRWFVVQSCDCGELRRAWVGDGEGPYWFQIEQWLRNDDRLAWTVAAANGRHDPTNEDELFAARLIDGLRSSFGLVRHG